jgi:hypothetical protein
MEPNEGKLEELILYIADQSVTDPDFGLTKLNKILFNADFTAYAKLGQPITGVEYQKLENGPAPRRLLPVLNELKARGEASITPVNRMGYTQKRVQAFREADLAEFSGEEIAIVDGSIEIMKGMSARRVSDLSHEFIGWQVVDTYETIPYETVFVSTRSLTEREKTNGVELVRN